MTAAIQTLLLLVAVLVVVAIVARRFNIAPPILLVIAGILLALAPGLPRIELAPELVLLGILPPLIYLAGVAMSWREFRFNLRPIALLAFGCVLFTACAVAAMAHWLLGMPLAVGFVLGAIVAPPDAVAPLSVMRQLGVPRRLAVILQGEGVANDATALILYRFAVAAVGTGLFSLAEAAGTFVLIVVGEIAYGIGIGWLSLRLRRWTREPLAGTAGSAAALAMGVLPRIRRRARRRFTRGGARCSADHRNRYAVSLPQSHSLHHVRCDRRDLGWPGIVAAERRALARAGKPRRRR